MMNIVAITGRTTAELIVKSTKNDRLYLTFTLACDRDYKNQEGERDTDFIPCVAWGKTAELIQELSGKGELLTVEGRFETRNYEDEEGNRKYFNQVNVSKFHLLERKKTVED